MRLAVLRALVMLAVGLVVAPGRAQVDQPIVVWTVHDAENGHPLPKHAPDGFQQDAAKLGLRFVFQAIEPDSFTDRFMAAREAHDEPDIIIADNRGLIFGSRRFRGLDLHTQKSIVRVRDSLGAIAPGSWQFSRQDVCWLRVRESPGLASD